MRAVISLTIVFFFLLSTTTPIIGKPYLYSSAETEKILCDEKSSEFTPHSLITIYGNTDFTVNNGVTGGNGTEDDPYIIEGWEITGGKYGWGITIKNTDAFFVIRKCYILNCYNGVYFENVSNSKIENSVFESNGKGVYFVQGTDNLLPHNHTIVNTTIYNGGYGISMARCMIGDVAVPQNITIINCSIYNNEYSAVSASSPGIIIYHSNIHNDIHTKNTNGVNTWGYNDVSVNATYNWWGSSDGPGGIGPGSGENVTFGVTYDPWLTKPWGSPPESYIKPITPQWYNANTNSNITLTVNVTEPPFHNYEIKNITLYYRYKAENNQTWSEWAEYATIPNKPWTWQFNATQITQNDSYYEFYSIATDIDLNIESSPLIADAACGIDTTPPMTNIDDALTSGWQKNTVIMLNAADNMSGVNKTYYKIWENNTTPPLNWTDNTTVTLTEDGTWNLRYYSVDNAGNQEDIINKIIQVDTTPPNTTHNLNPVTPDGVNGYYITPVTVQLTSSDTHSGVSSTFYRINAGEWHKMLSTTPEGFTVSQDGEYLVEYYSADCADNTENIKTVTFKMDVTLPQISITNTTRDTEAKTIMVTWTTTSSDIESYMVKIDDTGWVNVGITNPYVNSYTFINVASGGHIIYVKAVDNAGNTNTAQQSIQDNMGGANKGSGDVFWIVLIIAILIIIFVAIIIIIAYYKKRGRKGTKNGGEK